MSYTKSKDDLLTSQRVQELNREMVVSQTSYSHHRQGQGTPGGKSLTMMMIFEHA